MEYCTKGSLLSKKWKKSEGDKELELKRIWKYFRDFLLGLDYSNYNLISIKVFKFIIMLMLFIET